MKYSRWWRKERCLMLVTLGMLQMNVSRPADASTSTQERAEVLPVQVSEAPDNVIEETVPGSSYFRLQPGYRIVSVMVPFDLRRAESGCEYQGLRLVVEPYKGRLVGGVPVGVGNDPSVSAVSAIPMTVDRAMGVERSKNIAAAFAKAAAKFSFGYGVTESYERLYRTVEVHLRPPGKGMEWVFSAFQDETILTGTYFVVALFAVPRDGVKRILHVGAYPTISRKTFFGTEPCAFTAGGSWVEIPGTVLSDSYLMDGHSERVITVARVGQNSYLLSEPNSPWPWSGNATITGDRLTGLAEFSSGKDMRIEGVLRQGGEISIEYIFLNQNGSPSGRVDRHRWLPVDP